MSEDDPPSRREKDGCHDDDDVPPPPSSSSSSPWQDTWPPAALAMAKQALLLTSQGWPLTGQDQDAPDEPGATGHRRPRDVTAIDVSDVLGPSYSPSTVRHPSIAQSGLAAATVEIAERMVSLLLMRIVALVTWRLEREEEEEEEEDGEHEGENDKDAADEKKQPMQQKQQRRRRKRKKRMYSDLSTTTIAKTALLGHACSSHSRNDDNEDSNNNNNNNNSVNYDDRETMLSPLPRHSSEPGFLASNIFPSTISFQTDSSHSNNNPSNPSDDPLTLRRPPPIKTRQPPRWPTRITPLLVSQLRQYVLVICENYRTVPYHNVEHAYHVFLSANKLLDLLLSEGGKKGGDAPTNSGRRAGPTFGIKSDPLAQLALLFSALVHDVDHRGISNRQLVLESDDLAILYNDQSVAEQRSLAVAFAVWMMPEYGVLRGVLFDEEKKGQEEKEGKGGMKTEKKNNNNNNNREEHFKFRKLVIDLVLVTDIASPERTQIVKSKWKEAFGEIILTANLNHRKGTKRGGSGGVGGGGNDRDRDKERNREKETEIRKERERNEGQIERRREHGEVDAAKTATANTTANTTAAEAAALVAAEFFASSEDGIPSESNPGGSHRPVSAPGAAASSSEHGSQTHNRKGGAMAVPMAVPATATATTTATSTTQVIQKHSNASNNIKRGGMPSSSSSSSSSTGRGGGGAMQKQGSFTRRGRGMPMPKQLQKQGSIKNLELMSTLDEDDDGDDDDELSVKSFDDLDLGARAAKYLNGNHDNISNNNNNGSNNDNCNINTLKSKWMPSKQPPPQRGISRRHSLSSKIGMPSATERKKKRRPRPESQPLRNSFLSVADSVADSVIESVLHSVDLSSGSSYSSEEGEYSLEDQFDTSFVSRQKMNFDDDGGGMSIDSRAFSIVCCNDDGDNDDDDDDHHDDVDNDRDDSDVNDDIPPRSSPPSIPPKDTSDDTIPTNVRLNPTPPMTSISTEETPINKRTGPRLIQSLSAGNLEAMMDDHPSDSPADKFRPTFRPPRLTPNRHDRRNTDEGPRPSLRRPPNRHRFLSRSMISPGEFKRSTPRAHSQERRLGVRRALDLAGSTIEAFKSSYQSGHSSDMEYLLDDDPDEVDELKATVVLEQMMRAADVAALLQDWENVMKWSTRLYKELKNGYLAERGEDPSVGWFDNQIKFFDFYILPLAKNLGLTGVFEEEVADCFVQCVKNNLARWIEEGERETDLMMKLDEQERRNSAEGERISSHGSCEDDAGHSKDGRTIRRSSQADEYIASDLASSMYSLNSGLANSVHNNSGDLEADIALYSASSADKKNSARNAVNGGDKKPWR